jgi:hypothetical protein
MSKGNKVKRGQAKAAIEASLQIALEQARLLEVIICNNNINTDINTDINVDNTVVADR